MPVKQLLYFIYFIAVFGLFSSCSTKKNTVVSRAYHNVTARYNGYYYSCENINEGIYKLGKSHKDNFDKILPVYIYPAGDKAKATFAEFDKAIKKSSLCIQRHAIKDKGGNEIPSSGKWIDNNWINIGIAHLYKRELFSGLESFEYVARTYTKSKDKYLALLWMIRANNEIGSVSNSETIISLLKNEKKLPAKVRSELPAAEADYYMRRGQYTEAATKLMEASRNGKLFNGIPKSQRARYTFIIAQLFEAQKENKRAIAFYKQTIKLKPSYDLVFYSKIKMARLLDVKRNSSEKTKKDLLKMSKEEKNSDYFDVIYYTLGELEEKEKNTNQALYYYKRSVQTSTINASQKALSYLKLGEINFDLANYQPAEAYYDSAVVTLPKDHQDYNNILARKKTLEALVKNIRTIKNEDSLQRVSKMSEAEQNAFIDKIIDRLEKEEERKQKEKEAALNNANSPLNNTSGTAINNQVDPVTGATSFYFYNPNTIAFGVADFVKKWGNRKLEDNWRRSNKALSADDPGLTNNSNNNTTKGGTKSPDKTREYYKKNLLTNDSLIGKSNNRIINAYYSMGGIYKEDLNNNKKAIAAYEELNQRFPSNKYLLNTYYVLYRIYEADKKADKAEYYKQKLLTEFPDSEFALLIKNPNYATERNSKKGEVENFYVDTYKAYQEGNYAQSYKLSNEGISQFGKNEFLPKFEFIRALSLGKTSGVDSMEIALKLLVAKHPKAEVTPLANDILLSIKRQKNPEMFKPNEPGKIMADTFTVNFEAEHFIIAVVADENKIPDNFKTNLDAFCSKYYQGKQFSITSNLFGTNKQMVILKTFLNAQEAANFHENLMSDKDVFKGPVKKELVEIYPILASSLPYLYKSKNFEGYKLFYADNYKKFSTQGNQKQ